MASEDWEIHKSHNPFYYHKSMDKFKDKVNDWEFKFLNSIHNKFNLTSKQLSIANKIHEELYKSSNIRRTLTNGYNVDILLRNTRNKYGR